jgi:MoaA/NifB/PqqE/SkfB family radical SAM enzyme
MPTTPFASIEHPRPSPFRGAWYYLRCKTRKMPSLLNLEITKRCNARCSFCSCWQVDSRGELADYSPIVQRFQPVVVSVSGGEPLLRKDHKELLARLRPHCHYLVLITNGALLDERRARGLVEAGVDQICVSLDYLGTRHDEVRQIEGLYAHLSETIPALAAAGYRVALNTIIMESNLGEVLPIVHRAKEWGAMISLSAFCALKRSSKEGMIEPRRMSQLVSVVEEVRRLKGTLGHIKNSDYYLRSIPRYFRDGFVPNCKAGFNWVQVTPDGYIQQCSELPRVCHYSDYDRRSMKPVACAKCWYACRGEAEAQPLAPQRLMELLRS